MSGQNYNFSNQGRGRGNFARNRRPYGHNEPRFYQNQHQNSRGQVPYQTQGHPGHQPPPCDDSMTGYLDQGMPPGYMTQPPPPPGTWTSQSNESCRRDRSQSGGRDRSQSGGRDRSQSGGRDRFQSGGRDRSQSGGRDGSQSGGRSHENAGEQTPDSSTKEGARGRSRSGERVGQQQNHGSQKTRWGPEHQGTHQQQGVRRPWGRGSYQHGNARGYNQGNYQQQQQGWGEYNSQQHQDWNNSGNSHWQPRRKEQDDLVFLSKTLSSVLRHNAERFGFTLMKGGFLYVDDILKYMAKLRGFTMEDIEYVVASNDKKRFTLEKDPNGRVKIRANQGHTLEVEELDLKPITSADEFPKVIHGTYYASWDVIKRTGLCRMKRNHIHFAAGMPGQDGVISGMRSSCEVLIYIDLEKALKDGLKFFLSSNNVILCPGNEEGYLFPCYFQGALDRRANYRLEFDSTISSLKRPATAGESSTDHASKKSKKKKKKKNKEEREFDEIQERKPKQKGEEASAENPAEDIFEDANDMFAEEVGEVPDKWEDAPVEKPKREAPPEKEAEGPPSKKEVPEKLEDVPEEKPKQEAPPEEKAVAPPSKKDPPDWNVLPTVVTDVDQSKCAVDYIMAKLSPSDIAVCCCGRGLGTAESDITMLVVLAKPDMLVYHFHDDLKSLMTEGGLKDLLMSKDIRKIFHNIGSVSLSLIQEFDILLNGVPITDIALICEKCVLPAVDLEKKFDIKPAELKKKMKSWEIENDELMQKLVTPETTQDMMDTLVQRGKLILELYDLCSSRITPDVEKKLKKDIYQLAVPDKKDFFLAEKIAQLKLAAKGAKKGNKEKQGAEGNEQSQASTSQGQKQEAKQSPKKGGGKKKRK